MDKTRSGVTISVVIPLYNGKDKIVTCLTELDRQTTEEPYEVLVVDDKSPDDSADVVEKAISGLENPERFRLIRSPENGRAGKARNTGVAEAKGTYVVFIDQDDYPDRDMLRVLYDLTENGKYDVTACDVRDRNGSEYHRPRAEKISALEDEDRYRLMGGYGYVFAILIRKEVLTRNGLAFPEKVMFEDTLYNFGLLSCAGSINTTDATLYYRDDDETSQTAHFTTAKLEHRVNATLWYLNHYRENERIRKYLPFINQTAFYYIYLSCIWWMIIYPDLYGKELFRRCMEEGKKIDIRWDEVMKSQQQLEPSAMKKLKRIYDQPWTAEWYRAYYRTRGLVIGTLGKLKGK